MKGYSNSLPEGRSVLLMSYSSKSGGNSRAGASSRAMLPVPVTDTFSEAASWVARLSRVSAALMLKLPTAPLNDAGAPWGRGLTLTLTGSETTLCLMVR